MRKTTKNMILYRNIKPMDIVLVGDRGIGASVIRLFTSKRSERRRGGRRDICTHTAMVVEIRGQLVLAEMLPKGLVLSSIEKYNTTKRRKPYIIDIIRPNNTEKIYPKSVKLAQDSIVNDLRHQLEYDWAGDFNFAIKKIKQNPNKAFCSEYCSKWWRLIGVKMPFVHDSSQTPHDFQTDMTTKSVKWK